MWMRKTSIKIIMKSTRNFTRITACSHFILVSCILTCVTTEFIPEAGLTSPSMSPSVIKAVLGEVIYLKITQPVEGQIRCMYRMSGGKDVDVHQPHKENIEAWTKETCGIRINNVTMQDSGLWRLSSMGNNNVARGISLINVQRAIAKPREKEDIDLTDDDITPVQLIHQTSYCYVLRPDQTASALPNHEMCTLPKLNSTAHGTGIWNIVSGVKGKTHEVTFQVNVRTNVEELHTFVEHNLNSLNMKCKLVNSNKLVKFCRFLRLNDDVGFNLEEGRGELRYRYFGNGFQDRECGISIANPDENDKSPWKCFVGVDDEGVQRTLGSIIDASDPQHPYTQGDIETSDVYGLQETNVNILCKRNVPTDYCWFQDPSGRRISVSDKKALQPTDLYGYYGTGIKFGECGLTIVNANLNQSGTWSCHMGSTHTSITDAFQEITVRITETSLVSTNLIHDAQHGTSLVLECRSIPEYAPLDYCRFVLPDGTGFSMNEKTTANNPLMNNYYFNPNRQLRSGYCSMIVQKIDQNMHQGQWLCAAHLTGDDHESLDQFRVNVFEADNSIAVAGITGMAFVSVLVIGGIGFIAFKKYRQIIVARSRRTTRQTVVTYVTNTERVSISSSQLDDSQSTTDENIQLRSIESRC